MRLSKYYLPLLKEIPSDSIIKSHEYSLRAGLIAQVTSGIYTWLPLGLKVLKNIEKVVRDEMNKAGFSEILMPIVQPASLWHKSGRYDDYGKEMLRFKDRHEKELLFGPTHEELITDLISSTVSSYKELPISLYQIGWKFRDELRPRSGLIRAREFLMKDAYSFDIDKENALKSYDLMLKSYIKIFKRLGLNSLAIKSNSGEVGGSISHEFHVASSIGESTIYYNKKLLKLMKKNDCNTEMVNSVYTAADNMHDQSSSLFDDKELISHKSIEIGQLFYLDNKYSKTLNAYFHNHLGKNIHIKMGCYGIGISRLVSAIIEKFHDEKGIIWPAEISPFKVGLINLYTKNDQCNKIADYIYNNILGNVLYDDKNESSGIKFARMDLIGLPWQIIIGKKYIEESIIEVKNRANGKILPFTLQNLLSYINDQA